MLSQRKKIIEDSFGGAQPNISQAYVREIDIPTPPLTEQKRIVEKLDVLLTRINTAIEHLHSKLDLSKQLFDSILDEFFKRSDCDSVPLTEVVDFIGGSQPPKSQFSDVQKEGYVRLIQIRDYKTDNHIVYVDSASTKKFCTKEDVMIGRYGPPVFQILRGLDGAYNVALMKAVPIADPKKRFRGEDINFKAISSPIRSLDFIPDSSSYKKIKKDHYVLDNDIGYD